ncbi:hypothetical protein J6590_058640 [Homalodisca vitripennis]|nr:hypothetical protein J6590_058640 [Homalodisca vitripennis]
MRLIHTHNCLINAEVEEKDEYDNIQEVISNLSKIYEDPTKSTHRHLLETGILYLDKLLYLEDAVKEGVPKAERLIRKLHKDGAYDQLKSVPFKNLINHYGWNSMEVAEYENIVHRAKEIWRYFLDEITYGSFEASTTPVIRPKNDKNEDRSKRMGYAYLANIGAGEARSAMFSWDRNSKLRSD